MARIGGAPSNDAVLKAVREVTEAARRDGLRVATSGGKPVFVQLCYDIKHGWNAKGQVSMGVWLAAPFNIIQDNEVGVVIESDDEP